MAGHRWSELVQPGLQVAATVVVALLVRLLLHRSINAVVQTSIQRAAARQEQSAHRATRAIAEAAGLDRERHRQRASTTGSLLRSVTTVVVFALALLTVMGILGVPLAPLIASAGVGGVALGFGAQSLVRDFLSGIFMVVEDQYGVGDVVDTGNLVGTVEDVSLRITRLRDGSGVVWYVRNGEILRLGNQTQGWSTATVDVPLSYGQDREQDVDAELASAMAIIRSTAQDLSEDPSWSDRLVRAPEVLGIESLAAGVCTVRVVLACAPGDADPAARELRGRLLPALAHARIQLAAPGSAQVGPSGEPG